jgi:hypothetical protein
MEILEPGLIKHRDIAFRDLHPDPHQARSAALFLGGVGGVIRAAPTSPLLVQVSYDLLQVTLEEIEEALKELGLHIDNGILFRIRRALYYYAEETQRANLGCSRGESNCTRKVFALRYRTLNHACRDRRPEHWRRYL